jgi:signal transduction histidine kinase
VAAAALLAEGIRRALDPVRSVVPQGVTLELRESEIAAVLSVHEVFQVVANLVANAVFATKGGGRIAVEIERPRGSGHSSGSLSA